MSKHDDSKFWELHVAGRGNFPVMVNFDHVILIRPLEGHVDGANCSLLLTGAATDRPLYVLETYERVTRIARLLS